MSYDFIASCIEKLKKCEYPKEGDVYMLCQKVKEILATEPNVLSLNGPITVCGDIHGQFYDLVELFKVGGDCPYTTYLFMGDWVDRGFFSVETLLWLLALKAQYPDRVALIRGNHESRQITQVYGFYDECLRKFGSVRVWRYCADIFDHLPIAAVVNGSIFCVHGGLSPEAPRLDDIREVDRLREVPHDGMLCDLLWSDPEMADGWTQSPRGAGFIFGEDIVGGFLHSNNLTFIARAHQLVMEGHRWWFSNRLVTVWSAPNYCYRCGNIASIMEVAETNQATFRDFGAAPQHMQMIPQRSTVPDYFL